ncbi:MAG: hypothetical protein QXJ68_04855 [Methanocellales archaeon]
MKSFAHLYIMNLLYNEPQGLTCTMIYCSYKKDILKQEVSEEMSISRSHMVDHLDDFETVGLVKKGAFKQYMLTEKGKIAFEFLRQLALDISKNPKLIG